MINHKIALFGAMRSGKDEIAKILVRDHGFTRFAFGDGIRSVCKQYFPEQMKDGHKPRALFQGVGQDLRKYNPDVWINHTLRNIDITRELRLDEADFLGEPVRPLNVVITDVRQPNEYAKLKELGYFMVSVESDWIKRLNRMAAEGDNFKLADLNHETESHFKDFRPNLTIFNNGSLADLEVSVSYLVHKAEGWGRG